MCNVVAHIRSSQNQIEYVPLEQFCFRHRRLQILKWFLKIQKRKAERGNVITYSMMDVRIQKAPSAKISKPRIPKSPSKDKQAKEERWGDLLCALCFVH
jgi:hypothetical protein